MVLAGGSEGAHALLNSGPCAAAAPVTEKLDQAAPRAGLLRRVAAVPGVKAYLESPLRLEKVNNNGLG